MPLPTRNTKDYLEISPAWAGFSILAHKPHADELDSLLRQRGLPCQRQMEVRPGEDALRFDDTVDRAKVNEVLEAYKQAKGS